MKRTFTILVIALLLIMVTAIPCLAWGPNTHLEIDKSINESTLFRQGSVFPDMALALHYAAGYLWHSPPDNYMEIHHTLHSREFADILWDTCQTNNVQEFVEGWICHTMGSDPVESAYTADKLSQGAPNGVDWCVDWYYQPNNMDCSICPEVKLALQQALAQTDLDWMPSSWYDWDDIEYIYEEYLDIWADWYVINGYDVVAQEWYSDHEWYIQSSVAHSFVEILSYQGSATMTDVLQCINWWEYGRYLDMSDVLKVVNLWLYLRN